MPTKNTIPVQEGEKLRLFMEREKITQYDLSDATGTPQESISRMWSGKVKVSTKITTYLHKKHDLNFNWFFAGTGTMKLKTKEERRLVTDITDLLAVNATLVAKVDRLEGILMKLHSDFYAQKHGV
jgi:transcriptional regulator with XRE-family HTH domain